MFSEVRISGPSHDNIPLIVGISVAWKVNKSPTRSQNTELSINLDATKRVVSLYYRHIVEDFNLLTSGQSCRKAQFMSKIRPTVTSPMVDRLYCH